ncbi:MAG: hypothetical protein IT173_15385, partial [Acidobacteria bacterium]|nr:hypothetical protein [Acidobacteriota bacterium]
KAAVSSLEDEDRLILKLYYFDGQKLKDIARLFDFHEATASRKLVRIQSEVRKAAERDLRQNRGWSEKEVKLYLSDAASKLDLSMEKLMGLLLAAAALQGLLQ